MTREEQFLAQLPVVERLIGWVCARQGLRGADADDFASEVKIRLIENDYEILAKFEGRSSLKTYLAVVINRLYLDFQVQRFGRWRTSAEARRLGPVAVRLERLLYRDGLTFAEACGVLGSDPRVSESPDALHDLRLRLPRRTPRVHASAPGEAEGPASASTDLEQAERQALADRTFGVIRTSIARRPARERLFLRLHLVAGLTVAEVSRSLGLDQKALYRRKDEVFKGLRADLEAEGIGAEDARELLSVMDWNVVFLDEAATGGPGREEGGARPSPCLTDADRQEGER